MATQANILHTEIHYREMGIYISQVTSESKKGLAADIMDDTTSSSKFNQKNSWDIKKCFKLNPLIAALSSLITFEVL